MKKRRYLKYAFAVILLGSSLQSQAQIIDIIKMIVEKVGSEVVFEQRKKQLNEIIGQGDAGLEGLQRKNREVTKQYQTMYNAINSINASVRGLQEVKDIIVIGKNTAGLTTDTIRRLRNDEYLTYAQKTALVIQLVQLQNNSLDMMNRRIKELLGSNASGSAQLKMNDSERIRQLTALRDEMNDYYRATIYLRQKSAYLGSSNRQKEENSQLAMSLLYLH